MDHPFARVQRLMLSCLNYIHLVKPFFRVPVESGAVPSVRLTAVSPPGLLLRAELLAVLQAVLRPRMPRGGPSLLH